MATSTGMSPGDIVLAGARDFGARWKDLVTAAAVVVIPVSVVGVAAVAMVAPDPVADLLNNTLTPLELEESLRSVTPNEWIRFGVAYGIFIVLSGIANAVAFGACLAIQRDHLRGQHLSYGDALRESSRRWHSFVWLFLLGGVASAVGLILCLLPGLWLIVSWAAAPAVLMHEGLKGRRALGRSFRLTRARFWPTSLVVLLEFVGLGLIQSGATSFSGLLLPSSLEQVAESAFFAVMLLSTLAGLVTISLHASIVTRLYLDLVARTAPPPPVGAGT